ncbi:MAG TPA: hypothetical protein VGD59_10810 [Acidisarcina sp.]
MSTNLNDPVHDGRKNPGYEMSDVSARPILVFIVSLAVFVGVFFVACYLMGKIINYRIQKHDGPPNQWNAIAAVTPDNKVRNMASNPAIEQQQLAEMTQRFPTPRLQTDDGNQDLADLHAREDLLLEHYSWVDHAGGKVRIPIERAMELIAQRGLPLAADATDKSPLLTGDVPQMVQMPLTNGFTRTGYEQEQEGTSKNGAEQNEGSGQGKTSGMTQPAGTNP